jgi:hypothetical protein
MMPNFSREDELKEAFKKKCCNALGDSETSNCAMIWE